MVKLIKCMLMKLKIIIWSDFCIFVFIIAFSWSRFNSHRFLRHGFFLPVCRMFCIVFSCFFTLLNTEIEMDSTFSLRLGDSRKILNQTYRRLLIKSNSQSDILISVSSDTTVKYSMPSSFALDHDHDPTFSFQAAASSKIIKAE